VPGIATQFDLDEAIMRSFSTRGNAQQVLWGATFVADGKPVTTSSRERLKPFPTTIRRFDRVRTRRSVPGNFVGFPAETINFQGTCRGPEQARSEGSINGPPLGCGPFWDAKPVENKVTILIPGAAMAASGSVEIVDGAKTTGVMRSKPK
jgi:hypothetical protein